MQQGSVHDAETAGKWLRAYFSGSFLYGELLSARLAYEAFGEPDGLEKLLELEAEVRAARVPRETREALQKLGRRLAKNVTKIGLPFAARSRPRWPCQSARPCSTISTHSSLP